MEIAKDLHAFVWKNPRENNTNTYLISGSKKILIDPGHLHLFDHVRSGLARLQLSTEDIDVVLITHAHPDLRIGDVALEVIMTPGHSPGSLCFYWPDRKALFTGDVIFSQSIGRTDLPGGSGKRLKESIMRLSTLEVDYLLSGHSGPVLGKEAVQDNFRMVADYWFSYLDE
jgi:hydroxyacylglutathione hydrolase